MRLFVIQLILCVIAPTWAIATEICTVRATVGFDGADRDLEMRLANKSDTGWTLYRARLLLDASQYYARLEEERPLIETDQILRPDMSPPVTVLTEISNQHRTVSYVFTHFAPETEVVLPLGLSDQNHIQGARRLSGAVVRLAFWHPKLGKLRLRGEIDDKGVADIGASCMTRMLDRQTVEIVRNTP